MCVCVCLLRARKIFKVQAVGWKDQATVDLPDIPYGRCFHSLLYCSLLRSGLMTSGLALW